MKDMLAVVLVLRAVYEVAHYRVETPWKLIEEWRKYSGAGVHNRGVYNDFHVCRVPTQFFAKRAMP